MGRVLCLTSLALKFEITCAIETIPFHPLLQQIKGDLAHLHQPIVFARWLHAAK